MLTRSWFDALKSRFTRTLNRQERRASGRRGPPTRLLKVETLEDRRVLAFAAPVNYDAGTNPQAIVSADFNGDGTLDLVTANYNSGNVSVLLGNAGGTFQTAQNSPTGSGPLSVAVGDFNADGKLDLATANAGDVSVLLGNGDGTFGAATSIGVAGSPQSVAVGDFNGDGKLDLGVTSNVYYPGSYGYWGWYPGSYAGLANVLLGTGAGSFAAATVSNLGSGNHTSAAVADFNGDLKLDFASSSYEYGTVDVVLGTGTGSFGSPVAFSTGYYPYTVAAGDVNGDSKPDLVTANFYGNTVSVLLGTGTGATWAFGAATNYAAGSQPRSVALADFNGDGKIDLATANGDTGTVSVLLGTGTGSFKPPVNAAAGSYPLGVAVGDFNGDSRPDMASANYGTNNVSVLLNDGVWPALNAPSISINNALVAEGQEGTTVAEFTVTLSAIYTEIVTVHYATADYSALAGSDYEAAAGTLIFLPGETRMTIPVLVSGDRVVEYSEFFYLRLSDATSAFLARATGAGNIMDDEPRVSIDYGPIVVTEGNTGTTTNALFTVRLSAPYDVPVSVNLSTVEGDTDFPDGGYYGYYYPATLNTDFQDASRTLTFDPGVIEMTIPITINGDRDGEPNEYFSANLSNPTFGTIIAPHAVGIIANDEPYASISGGGNVVEGNTGTKNLIFTVTLSAPSDAPVTVDFATTDGSATAAGGDYQAQTGTLTFPIGQTSQDITVLVNGDRLGEYDEYLYVNLTGATGAVLYYYSIGYGTIVDNEPRLSINSVSLKEGNSGTSVMTFTVSLSAPYDQAVTVNYATQDSSATAGSDYVATSGMLTFAAGQTTKTVTVTIRGDKAKEANESFYVLLSGVSSNALISNAYGWGTILNDEPGKGNGKGR